VIVFRGIYLMERLISLLGLAVFLGIAFLLSTQRSKVSLRLVFWGLGLQFSVALLVIGVPALGIKAPLGFLFTLLNDTILAVLGFGFEGTKFLFGNLLDEERMGGVIFAFRVLPSIIFFSCLMSVLYYFGVLQKIVYAMAWVMKRSLGTSGPETLSAAGNVFLGQTEAPLLVKPYLKNLSNSELLCVMIGGMASVAGGVLAAYILLLQSRIPEIAGHLITVSAMSAPAALLIAKVMIPTSGEPRAELKLDVKSEDANVVDAATRGASEGLMLALNVGAMLIAFVGLIALLNGIVHHAAGFLGFDLNLQTIFGYVFTPVAWLLGVPSSDLSAVGQLLGEKIVLNEFVAYLHLSEMGANLSDRGVLIASYALCGFANIASIGIQVGGIGALAPERRGDLARLGWRALIGGNLATFMSAAIVGLLT
jgi:concentrative nucleoside transporter, CNT family